MRIRFTVPGEPMGKQRPRAGNVAGHTRIYTPKETLLYENKVVFFYSEAAKGEMLFGAEAQLCVTIVAYFQIPKKEYRFLKRKNAFCLTKKGEDMKSGSIRPTKKPDVDNISKIILDALNGVAYRDDKCVVEVETRKYYSEKPMVEVTICELI